MMIPLFASALVFGRNRNATSATLGWSSAFSVFPLYVPV